MSPTRACYGPVPGGRSALLRRVRSRTRGELVQAIQIHVATVMNARSDPFFLRDLGLDAATADALFAQAVSARLASSPGSSRNGCGRGTRRAERNPRGLRRLLAGRCRDRLLQLRSDAGADDAPSGSHRRRRVLGPGVRRLAGREPRTPTAGSTRGVGWASDSYRLDGERLAAMGHFGVLAWSSAMSMAGEGRSVAAVELERPNPVSRGGLCPGTRPWRDHGFAFRGVYAQNPLVATGLLNAAEAVLQVAGNLLARFR